MNPDEGADKDLILEALEPFRQAIVMISEHCKGLEERIERLEDGLYNQVIGGIEKLYTDNQRTIGKQEIWGKHGDKFAPHMEPFKALFPDTDLEDLLYERLNGLDDESANGTVEQMVKDLESKLSAIKAAMSGGGDDSTKVVVEGTGPEVEKVAEAVADPMDELAEKVKRMSKRTSKL